MLPTLLQCAATAMVALHSLFPSTQIPLQPMTAASAQSNSVDNSLPSSSTARPPYPIGLAKDGRIRACPAYSDCVSSAAREAPNKAMTPFVYKPTSRATSLARLISLLRSHEEFQVKEVDESVGYVHVVVTKDLKTEIEDIEFLVLTESSGVATFRDVARSKATRATNPPWCVQQGCINGNQVQRARISALGAELGWATMDSARMEEDSKWTPIFFNSDTVPADE